MATLDDDLAKAVTEGFRLAQSSIINQDLILSGAGDVTVTLADGSKKTGPSWTKLIAQAGAAGASAAAAAASEKNAKTSETNANSSKTAAANSATAAKTSETNAKTSETNAKTSETNSKASENNAAASASRAAGSLAAAQLLTSVPYEAAPFPDVWLPLNDDLRLLAGFAPYDRLTISGQVLELPTKSLTFSRATTATYIDKSGVLRIAAINEPRFEKEGLLIEGQGTNLVPNSQLTSSWRVANTTVTQAAVISPDGATNGVTRLASAGVANAPAGSAISVPISGLSVGGYCSFSVFAKADSHNLIQLRWLGGSAGVSNKYLNVDLSTGEIGTNNLLYAKAISMANGWWRIIAVTSIDGDLTGNSSADPGVELISSLTDGRRPSVSLSSGVGVYLYGPQLEAGLSSSYIPTTGSAATRAADDCTLHRTGNDNYPGPITFSVEMHCNGETVSDGTANSRRGILAFYPSTTEFGMLMLDSSTSNVGKYLFAYGPATFNVFDQRVDDGEVYRIAATFDGNNISALVNGNASRSPTPVTRPEPGLHPSVTERIYLGRGAGSNASGVRMLNGHIRNLRIWHRVLTPNQINGLR